MGVCTYCILLSVTTTLYPNMHTHMDSPTYVCMCICTYLPSCRHGSEVAPEATERPLTSLGNSTTSTGRPTSPSPAEKDILVIGPSLSPHSTSTILVSTFNVHHPCLHIQRPPSLSPHSTSTILVSTFNVHHPCLHIQRPPSLSPHSTSTILVSTFNVHHPCLHIQRPPSLSPHSTSTILVSTFNVHHPCLHIQRPPSLSPHSTSTILVSTFNVHHPCLHIQRPPSLSPHSVPAIPCSSRDTIITFTMASTPVT